MVASQLDPELYDVVVVGGGTAGLSGALLLARARRSVLVVDSQEPRNASARAVHGYLTVDGLPPAVVLARGAAEVRNYGGIVRSGTVEAARARGDVFEVSLADGFQVRGRRLLITTGLTDELPDVHGVTERWGRDVFHCPYCHGWEVRDQAVGMLATDDSAVDEVLLLRQWTANLTLLTHRGPTPSRTQRRQLDACGITLVEGIVESLAGRDDHLRGVYLSDGAVVRLQALVVTPVLKPRAGVLISLGVKLSEDEGTCVVTDESGATSVQGVWVAGNLNDPTAQAVDAASSGSRAAMALNLDLVQEDVARAVSAAGTPSG